MTPKLYYVNNGGDNLGPYSFESIMQQIAKHELKATDYLYLEDKDDWITISQHPEFSQKVQEKTAIAPTVVRTKNESETKEWFILKDKNRFGPFVFSDVVKMLQEKNLFEYDYVWFQGMDTWKRIAEMPEFAPDKIRSMISNRGGKNTEDVFYRRKHARTKYNCQVIAHDNSKIWSGLSVELSEAGAAIMMENAIITPGQHLYLHFKPGPHSKAFNVLGEIVSKRFVKDIKDREAPVVYGVKFVNMQKQDRESLKELKPAA